MELTTTGNFLLDEEVSSQLIKGKIFGLELNLLPEGLLDYKKDCHAYRFMRDKGEHISGFIDLGNGEHRRLVAYFIDQDPNSNKGHFKYTLHELSREDTDDASHPSNMGKTW